MSETARFLEFVSGISGVATLLVGFVAFFLLPMVVLPFRTKAPARLYLSLATIPIKRAAIVVSAHNDIVFKPMRFDAVGVEKITLDGEEKDFEDPDGALHYWQNIPFALADEVRGVLFDPRHAAAGMRKRATKTKGESHYLATEEEHSRFGVSKWVKGVFEMPRDHELVDLSAVRELAFGGERSDYGNKAEEYYKHSQQNDPGLKKYGKYLMPIAGFGIPFFGIWFMKSQFGTGGPTDSVSYGMVGIGMLGASLSMSWDHVSDKLRGFGIWIKSLNWRKIGAVTFWSVAFLAFEGFCYRSFGIGTTAGINVMLIIGYLIMPILAIITKPSKILSGLFSKLFFRLGFMAYQQPVFYWEPQGYQLKEFSHIDKVGETTWYGMFNSKVGFSYNPEPETWDAEVVPHKKIESRQVDSDVKSNLPKGFVPTNTMVRDASGAFVPKRVSDDSYYLHTARVINRFDGSASGEKTHLRFQEAKEKHGGLAEAMTDRTTALLTAGMGFFGAASGIWIFILGV